MTWDIEDLEELFSSLRGCCLHESQWLPEDVDTILCWIWRGCGDWKDGPKDDYGDTESLILVRLHNGDIGLFEEGEDYTGHGCQCYAYTRCEPNVDAILKYGVENDKARDAIRERLQ